MARRSPGSAMFKSSSSPVTLKRAVLGGLSSQALSFHAGPGSDLIGADESESLGRGVGAVVASFASKVGIEGNQFATGGLTLAVLGALAAGAGILWGYCLEFVKRKVIVSAEFDSRDEVYSWILSFLADHPMAKKTTRFSVTTSVKVGQRSGGDINQSYQELAPVYYLPSPGTHIFTFAGRILWLSRERSKPTGGGSSSPTTLETITINTLGRNRHVIERLIAHAQLKYLEKDRARTVVYSADQYGNWVRTRSRPVRPLETIVLDQGLKETLVQDVKEFIGSEKWYADRGIPYRRGYMFHGPPGTGKTSFVTALAGELKLNIYVMSLSNRGLTDENLLDLMINTPTRCILLLEDVDAAFLSRTGGPSTGSAAPSVSFSGLLNVIDGVAAQEGRVLCMTTNHLEKLDPALIRPGRVDVKVLLDRATQFQACELFVKFYPHSGEALAPGSPTISAQESEVLAQQFASVIPDRKYSIAHLQGYLMRYKRDPWGAVKNVDELVKPRDATADANIV
ncbi:hypothetical protein HDU85_007324 [Gaertneriomyces sp. JEL0708]|nr:hypothetical protein HDU85_007324 [Gaertneriomyces sp. JEL0708]